MDLGHPSTILIKEGVVPPATEEDQVVVELLDVETVVAMETLVVAMEGEIKISLAQSMNKLVSPQILLITGPFAKSVSDC